MDSPHLLDLPPLPTGLRAAQRFLGDGHDLSLSELKHGDQELLRTVYRLLESLYQLWRRDPSSPDWAGIAEASDPLAESSLRRAVTLLGSELPSEGPRRERLKEVLHDIRGGGLSAAMAEAELLHLIAPTPASRVKERATLQSLVYLARDHAKMMRNAIRDIDPEGRMRDEEERPHYISDLVSRWDGHAYPIGGRRVLVRAVGEEDAALSSCCLEASAVDRVIYNHISNAARFTQDGEVRLEILQVDGDTARGIISNSVSADQESWLRSRIEEDPAALYRTGVTRGGQGLGLGNAAHFVCSAFGVRKVREGLNAGFLGGRVLDGRYLAWFHWPLFQGSTRG
jgi:signal transduction histidine kinase